MTEAFWHGGPTDLPDDPGNVPFVWHVRLDDPEAVKAAHRARLTPADLEDLATRPDAGMRGLRRRLLKVLLSRFTGLHPDEIVIGRTALGAPQVVHPAGWNVSLAGRSPHCLIGLSRCAIGVDMEPLGSEPPPPDSFTPEEALALAHAPPAVLLARWTAKEAHAKYFGIASTIDADEIETRADGNNLLVSSIYGTTRVILRTHGDIVQALALA